MEGTQGGGGKQGVHMGGGGYTGCERDWRGDGGQSVDSCGLCVCVCVCVRT